MEQFIQQYAKEFVQIVTSLSAAEIEAMGQVLAEAYRNQRMVYVLGNGGSAATADHIACDLSKTVLGLPARRDGKGFRVFSLSANVAAFSAWANDEGYDHTFARQLDTLLEPGDVVVAVTASGNSANILEALRLARERGAVTVGFLGFDGGKALSLVDHPILVRSFNYGIVESVHLFLNHLLTWWFIEAGLPRREHL